ncbi:hypothetical protein NDU88_003422 [Pleurodeles waltl]|uniref:Uncharacterized protein n=1 Tax=Pleurodeles waltl TaxID=8319 RepID=A0AAV7TP31_PLEWA|nr:hypothetical protein NDU88_003422 [Pleurodeles waltl]
MRRKNPRTKYNPGWVFSTFDELWSVETVKDTMTKGYQKSKVYHDFKNGTKPVSGNVGEWGSIRKPGFVTKGDSKFYEPEEVVEILDNVVSLSNGQVWNLKQVTLSDINGREDGNLNRRGIDWLDTEDTIVDLGTQEDADETSMEGVRSPLVDLSKTH